MTSIAVVGAGVIGLAVCHALVMKGHQVTLFEPGEPGEGTSYGNAGLIANYATTPMANYDTLKQLPRMLARSDRSLAIDLGYSPMITHFGWRFMRAAQKKHHLRAKSELIDFLQHAVLAQHALLESFHEDDLYHDDGCLHVYREGEATAAGLEAIARTKCREGVECQVLSPQDISTLEPQLSKQDIYGGIFFPETRALRSPLRFSKRLFNSIQSCTFSNFKHVAARVKSLLPLATGGWKLTTGMHSYEVDKIVLCAGIENNSLVKDLDIKLPVVSERGYHIMLDSDIRLNRPVGWLKHHFYASPMQEGIRMAGTTEFCAPDKAPSAVRWSRLAEWGETLFGRSFKVDKKWVGVRHSTPDGLPVIGGVPGYEGLIMAFGHGHLGLTLSAETARIVAGIVEGDHLPSYAQSLSPQRFL